MPVARAERSLAIDQDWCGCREIVGSSSNEFRRCTAKSAISMTASRATSSDRRGLPVTVAVHTHPGHHFKKAPPHSGLIEPGKFCNLSGATVE
jgi:hypothetical protein